MKDDTISRMAVAGEIQEYFSNLISEKPATLGSADKTFNDLERIKKLIGYSHDILKIIEHMAPAHVQHAHWIFHPETSRFKKHWSYSKCEHDITENPRFSNSITGEKLDFRFYPFCGAVMILEGEKQNDIKAND